MNIAYHIFCYILCFVVAMRLVWYGERHTKTNPPKDEDEFEQIMVIAGVALSIFGFFHALLTISTW
jgi:hypothetical protein